jgi:hypothetical protein
MCSVTHLGTSADRRFAFEQIYQAHHWGGSSRSGPGSDPHNTGKYVQFIKNWLASHPDVRTIVEVGCGDWSTSSQIGFSTNHHYVGIDIVKSNIENDAIRYGTKQIQFIHSDFIEEPPPVGDVLIAKDVLQHLSNMSILKFIRSSLGRYRHAILTNDVRKVEYVPIMFGIAYPRRLELPNREIKDGGSRPVQVDAAPFNLKISESLFYKNVIRTSPRKVVYTKQIAVCNGNNNIQASNE